jgi:hypothetical protein
LGLALASLGLTACAPAAEGRNGSSEGGSAGTGGLSAAGTNGGVASGGAGAPAGAPQACAEVRELQRPGGTLVELGFAPRLAGKPFVFGERNAMEGGQVSPLNLRFYVSELSLVAADGSLVAVDLVSPAGQAEPYGIRLVNFEEPESTRLHVLAPPGSYAGAKFTFGISDACNQGGSERGAPLSVNSQMVWPHLAGFLFLRYEASWLSGAGTTATAPPSMIHMGGQLGSVFAPQATVVGSLVVPATGTVSRTVQVSFDEIFRGASSSEDVSNLPSLFQTPEAIAGERLRRAVPTLNVFQLAEP